jgi:hypothetical protein
MASDPVFFGFVIGFVAALAVIGAAGTFLASLRK